MQRARQVCSRTLSALAKLLEAASTQRMERRHAVLCLAALAGGVLFVFIVCSLVFSVVYSSIVDQYGPYKGKNYRPTDPRVCEPLPPACMPGCTPRNGSLHWQSWQHWVPGACLSTVQMARKNASVAYLLHGFIYKRNWNTASSRHGKYTQDIRDYWDNHVQTMHAMRAALLHVYFVTYVIDDEDANATLRRWTAARARRVITVPYSAEGKQCSQFLTTGIGLRALPRYAKVPLGTLRPVCNLSQPFTAHTLLVPHTAHNCTLHTYLIIIRVLLQNTHLT